MGLITPLGTGRQTFWENLLAGKTAIRHTDVFKFSVAPDETPLHTAAPLDFKPVVGLDETLPPDLYWADRLLCHATQMAMTDANLDSLPPSTAIVLGAGASSTLNIEEFESQLALDVSKNQRLSRMPPGILSSDRILANRFGLYGPKMMIATACSSSSLAMGYAYDLVSMGECNLVVVGCADTLSQLTHSGFYGLRSIAPDCCRPFDENRKGISIGEASIVLLLECEDEMRRRGGKPYCRISGYSANCDARGMTSPDESGFVYVNLMEAALQDASVKPEDVGYICAHGTGTILNDLIESKAIHQIFGKEDSPPFVSSVKGATGHCMAGAGILNCVVTALALWRGVLPPNTGMIKKDENCNIKVLQAATETDCRLAMTNAFGFGGNNICIVFEKS